MAREIPWKRYTVQAESEIDVSGKNSINPDTGKYVFEMNVSWWDKDYQISVESKYGTLSEGLHIMYMAPMIYTAGDIEGCCGSAIKNFSETVKFLDENPGYVEDRLNEYGKLLCERKTLLRRLNEERKEKSELNRKGEISDEDFRNMKAEYRRMESEYLMDARRFIHSETEKVKCGGLVSILFNAFKEKGYI